MSDIYNRVVGNLDGLPDVRKTRPTTVATVHPLIGEAQTFVIQTYRQHEQGDTVLLQYIDAETSYRIVIPPKVADTIARQRDALTKRGRSETGARVMAERMARGERPELHLAKGRRKAAG